MKFSNIFHVVALVASVAAGTNARLFHVPLGRTMAQDMSKRSLLDAEDVDQDNLYQARGVQYADLKVGCPAQMQSAIISTASPAIGFPCSGCTNDCGEGSHNNGLYHEKQSSCFSEVKCGDCLMSFQSCFSTEQCPIHMSYLEGSSWTGIEVEDMVSLGGEDEDDEAFPLRFGCQTDITGLFEDQIPDGIFGMNKEKGSAIMQWTELGYLENSAFSLCYTLREDVKKKSGVMVLGGTDQRLHETDMIFVKDVGTRNYQVNVKDIRLKRGSAMSASASGNNTVALGFSGNANVDSASTCTYLPREWHDSFRASWKEMTDGKYNMFSHLSITAQELNELPTIVFEVEGTKENETIELEYPPIRYMEKSDNGGYGFCMFSMDSDFTLGNTFMSGHDVLHDLDNKRLGFAQSKCEISLLTTKPGTPLQPDVAIESDADKEAPPPPNLKPVMLQSEPIHKREPAKTPLMDTLYVLIAVGLLALIVFAITLKRSSRWQPTTKHAYWLSWVSLLLTLFAIIAGVVLFASTGSSLFFVLALENCVDFLSSAIVLWRFFAPSSMTKELEATLRHREERASMAISFILVLLGFAVWATALVDISHGQEEPSQEEAALAISLISVFLFGVLTIVKFAYAKALESPSLYKDGICSLIGTTLSASLFVTTLIISAAPSAWWIDPTVALVCGCASIVYGVWSLRVARYKDNVPVFSLEWWFRSKGSEEEPGNDWDVKEETPVDHQAHVFT